MSKNNLTFVNHACFYIINDDTLLLIDPWVEGPVFNNGWSLLDNATSNAALIKELAAHKLNTFIWFSHEHPDHFSVPFVKRLRKDFPGKVTMLFQHTKDKRVATFLRSNEFEVIECLPGQTVALDPTMHITVFPYSDGDAYCLVGSNGRNVLNLNDCAITNADQCRTVQATVARLCDKVDVLFTQFGYANWVGNPFEPEKRRVAAAEKIARIALQMAMIKPRITVPFASFVSFSSIDNCYMNDHQNTARAIADWARQSRATDTVRFLKPGDNIDLTVDTAESLAWASDAAVEHWEQLGKEPCDLLPAEEARTAGDVQAAFAKHQKAVSSNLVVLPWLLEFFGLIKPLTMRMPDIGLTVRLSYIHGYQAQEAGTLYDISMTSPSAVFLLSNEYGFSTTHVNGRFRTSDEAALARFSRFFMPQNLVRQGYGVQHPLATVRYLTGNLMAMLGRKRLAHRTK